MNCYIHIPFCASKCGYCAFFSEVNRSKTVHNKYLDCLQKRLESKQCGTLKTLYIGGGTPTLLDLPELKRLISILRNNLQYTPDCEISIEANPETLTEEKVGLLRSFATRISLGVQSFNPALRESVGRKCSDEALWRAIKLISEAGFRHWNCDLIYSLPNEKLSDWLDDLHRAGDCGVDHVSCYSLTPEADAAMGENFTEDDERESEMYFACEQVLSKYGISRYEISNYAVSGAECKHNVNVWCGGLLRGEGPSAADFDGKNRHIEPASLSAWFAGEAPELDEISCTARCNEIFAVNLRTVKGWTKNMWEKVPGCDRWANRVQIAENLQKNFPGCVEFNETSIKLSAKGLMYWNDIAESII